LNELEFSPGFSVNQDIFPCPCLLLVISPYWLVSWEDTYSPFKNMGLWEFCFSRFRYPNYQFDKLFDGCHYIFSQEYYVIWEWILPGWLMAVQAFMTLGLIFSCLGQSTSTLLLVRWPLNFVFRFQWQMLGLSFFFNAVKTFCVFLAVAVFGGQCWRRDWLLYPNFNHLSWSFAFAVTAMALAAVASLCFYYDSRKMLYKKQHSSNLVMQMQPTNGSQLYI